MSYTRHLRLIIDGMDETLAAWKRWQNAQGLSHRTIEDRAHMMRHFFETTYAKPLGITPEHILAYVGRPGITQSSRATYHKHLRAYSKWLVKAGLRDDDPTLKTPVPRQPKGLPRPVASAELPLILKACNRRRTRMMVLLASLQGLRIHEIAKIRGEDVDLGGLTLTVNGKGGKLAILPLHETIALFAETFPTYGPWFPYGPTMEPMNSNGVGKAIRSAMRRAGVIKTPHQLRHWYGSTLVQNGVDLRTVQELLRHESLATTQIYTLAPNSARRSAIDGLHVA